MKVNQVIEVKPTLTEKEFLRLVLTNVASAEGAPFDVVEKIEFGEVKHTADYIFASKYKKDLEYRARIGYNSKVRGSSFEFTQWQEQPHIGVFSSDEVHTSVLARENSESELYKWGSQTYMTASSFIKQEFSDETYTLSTQILDKTIEIPSSETEGFETEGWVDYDTNIDADTTIDYMTIDLHIRDEISADEIEDQEILRIKKEIICNKVYKLHYYEVSYTYEGKTYYAKAIANKESQTIDWASDEAFNIPREEKSFDEIVRNKQKTPIILAKVSWILTYASAAVSIILSVLGNSSLWYLPFIMIAVSTVVTIICNRVSKEIGWSVYRKYNANSRRNNIMPSLYRRVEKLDLGEFTEEEIAKAKDMFKDPERPKDKKVAIGGNLAIAIPVAIGVALVAFCFGFAANL